MGFIAINKIQIFLSAVSLSFRGYKFRIRCIHFEIIIKWINIPTVFVAFSSEHFPDRELRILTTNVIFIKYSPGKPKGLQTRGLLGK